MTMLRRTLTRFVTQETGTLMAEAVLVLPFMLWSYLALFVYWDSFRAVNTVQKAAYTVSDMISREMVSVTDGYIDGMDAMMEYLIDPDQDATIRVSSITWSALNNRYEVEWSRAPGNGMAQLTTSSLVDLAPALPTLADGDFLVLVEAAVNYEPSFDVGMNDQTLREFIVTRPRFMPKICLVGVDCT
ncbi:TadE/TadG family type IV pilus assembly protein [Tabrizicola oligotrophica]|uniref:Pilus assembly protein n=1 Tax=Tabrizicola oligotrophica TaxID=2710650 RepID=A0A6M0QXW2_9RHOB|nr:pilus assembly protein [Tabrizicola oligotrophica]NEY91594.1 pilus assembly protein [Tabrizicola oligotrophica]